MPHNVVDMLFDAGKEYPNRTALRRGSRTYTHAQVVRRVSTIAANLRDRGVKKGDLFLYSVQPDAEGILLGLGIIAAGGVLMLNDPGTSQATLESRIEQNRPQYAIADSSLYRATSRTVNLFGRRGEVQMPYYSKLPVRHFFTGKRRLGVPVNAVQTDKLLVENTAEIPPCDAYSEAFVNFTPGDPEKAKTVRHTLASVGSALLGYQSLCGIDSTSRVYTEHFMFGAAALVAGGEWEIPEFSPTDNMRRWISPLYGDRASHVFLSVDDVPLVAAEIASRAPRPIRLKVIAMNSTPDNNPMVRKIRSAAPHVDVFSIQGMTEVLPYAHTEGAGKIAYGNGDLIGGIILGATARIDSKSSSKMDEFVLNGDSLMLGRLGKLKPPAQVPA